jgi:hypothetical protein
MQGAFGSATSAIFFRLGSHALSASNGLCPQEEQKTKFLKVFPFCSKGTRQIKSLKISFLLAESH